MKSRVLACGTGFAIVLAASAALPASAQYASDFEGLNASPDGVILTGQDGFFIPAGTDSTDYFAYTYAMNAIGIPMNPQGGQQFVGGTGPGSPTFARAQRDISWGQGIWNVTYDVAATYLGERSNPTASTTNRGLVVSGDLGDTGASDDQAWCWRPDALAATVVAPINIELQGPVNSADATRLSFNIEVAATDPGVVMRVELFNFTENAFAPATNFVNIPTVDTVFSVVLDENAADFIADTLVVRARVSFLRPQGVPPLWNICIDHMFWELLPPGANNLGSFSAQPSTTSASWIHLFSWVDAAEAQFWNAFYLAYDAGGTQDPQPGRSPGPEWSNLELNHWYRFGTVIDFDANCIREVSITDLETNETTTVNVASDGWFLQGGQGGGFPLPTAFRFFAGGGVPGNTVAWDNISISPQ